MLELATLANKGVMIGSQAGSGLATSHAALFASKAGIDFPSELSFPLKLFSDSVNPQIRYSEGFLDIGQLSNTSINF